MTNHKIRLRATMGMLGFGTFQTHESPTLWPSFQNSVPWANSLDPVQPLLACWLCFEFWCLPVYLQLLFFSPLVMSWVSSWSHLQFTVPVLQLQVSQWNAPRTKQQWPRPKRKRGWWNASPADLPRPCDRPKSCKAIDVCSLLNNIDNIGSD